MHASSVHFQALVDHHQSLMELREQAVLERRQVTETGEELAKSRVALNTLAEEAEATRLHVAALARATAREAEALAERQRQLQAQSAEILRGPTSGVRSVPRPRAPA